MGKGTKLICCLCFFMLCSCSYVQPKKFIEDAKKEPWKIETVQRNRTVTLYTDLLDEELEISLPDDVEVNFEFTEQIPIEKFINLVVRDHGYSVVVRESKRPVAPVSNAPAVPAGASAVPAAPVQTPQPKSDDLFYLSHFKGHLSELLDLLQDQGGYFVSVDGKVIMLDKRRSFHIRIPAGFELEKHLEKHLSALGADAVYFDPFSSRVSFSADYRAFVRCRSYLNKLHEDFSAVLLHVVMLDYDASSKDDVGLDVYKSIARFAKTGITGHDVTIGGDGTLKVKTENFDLSSYLGFIRQVTNSRIVQDLYLFVIGSYTGKIEANRKVPVIDNVTVSSTAVATQQGVNIKEIDVGSSIEVSANVDARSKVVYMNVIAQNQIISGYVTLSTGQSGISVDRPVVVKRAVNTRAVVSVEDILVLGGMNYEQDTVNYKGVYGFRIGNQKDEQQAGRLVIIIRPEVVKIMVKEG